MEGKKISFGFMKTKKAEKPITPVINEEKREYIECVEEKSIKVVGGEEIKNNEPLIIPMKPNTLITTERLKEIAEKVESGLEEPEIKQEPVEKEDVLPENETLEQMAVRELMQDAKKEVKVENLAMAIPAAAKAVVSGEKESTLDDYESVPIQEFGMAMLRGMGWTPNKDGVKYKQPELRPKGLGLGADKVVKENQKKNASKNNKEEDLGIVKNSFVKITTGKYSGYYGKVVSLDEDNGRVMVDITVKKETVSLSEFMMQAVTKSEYDKESKVINADSFEEYKKSEKLSQKPSRQEEKSSSSQKYSEREKSNDDYRRQRDDQSSNGRSRDKTRHRRDSSSSEDRSSRRRKKDKKRYSSNDSLSSLSEDEKRHKHRKHKSRKRRSRSRSNSYKSPTPEGKRDIDKKRKGKKKKRDRDRSPNYKKHRK